MNLTVKLLGHGGHSEVNFSDGKISLEWKSTTENERKMLGALVSKATEKGFKANTGKSDGSDAFVADGTLTLEGEGAATVSLAKGFVEAEISSGKLVMDATSAGEAKVLKIENLVIKQDAPQVVTSKAPLVGG